MIGVLFPGQGAQKVGMADELLDHHAAARELFDKADEVLGYSLSTLCREGPEEELTRTDRAQSAIYVTSAAAVVAAEAKGSFKCSTAVATAGLSLGEYTALWFAGALSFEDGLRLVHRRGSAMQAASEAVPSGMVSLLGADRPLAEKVCDQARGDGVLVVANLNSPGQVVVSGDQEACSRVPHIAKELGLRRAIPLKVAGAFHSPLMGPACKALESALVDTPITDPRIKVFSNVTGAPVGGADEIRDILAKQVVSPVLWENSMRAMLADGVNVFHEPPPGRTLAGMMKKIDRDADVNEL